MDVTHDIIAAVVAPDWKYGLSRILVNSENRGVVFIVGSDAPLVEFTVTQLNTSRGSGTLDDGGRITWRRRGSSCQYKLAKCKINTATMTERWTAAQGETKVDDTEAKVAEATAAKVESEPEAEEVVEESEPAKPKRTRRTKAQIEADKAAEDLL